MSLNSAVEDTLAGKITHKKSGQPLTGVTVKAIDEDTTLTTITDRYGYYEFDAKPGKYNITVVYFIHTDTTISNVEISVQRKELNIQIIPNTMSHYELEKHLGPEFEDTSPEKKYRRFKSSAAPGHAEAAPLSPSSDGSSKKERGKSPEYELDRRSAEGGEGLDIDRSKIETDSKRGDEDTWHSSSEGKAGVLTSGEVNDFRKWDLWKDIAAEKLQEYRQLWTIKPVDRYTVQLTTRDGKPMLDCPVQLVSPNDEVIWSGRTDNTGKAELWVNLFDDRFAHQSGLKINVIHESEIQQIDNIKNFHDGINHFMVDTRCNVPENLDILFAVDATGSMGDEIDYLKAELKDIIAKIKEKHDEINVNLGSIFYRDIKDEYIVRTSDLSTEIDETAAFIGNQRAGGGGDNPEAVEMCMQTAVNEISWSERAISRLMFLILDAPPHDKPEVKTKLKEITARAAMAGIRVIPVTCSGIDKSSEYLMRSIALATNGTYVFLTDHSGVGGSHIEPTTDKYDVELLNDLFIRLIDQFTVTPSCRRDEPIAGEEANDNIYNNGEQAVDESNPDYSDIVKMINCYPNPTNGALTIDILDSPDEMYLVDIAGKILQRFSNPLPGKTMVDLNSCPTGIYFIKYLAAGKWASRKILLHR